MAISYTDSLGTVLDTGTAVQPAVRPATEVETHGANEVDSGSKLTVTQTVASHVPHRAAGSPR